MFDLLNHLESIKHIFFFRKTGLFNDPASFSLWNIKFHIYAGGKRICLI